jgi:hypothetical protein
MRTRLALALALGGLPATAAEAQTASALRDSIGRDDRNFSFYARGPYRAAVPRPESILGYNVGDLNTQFALQERVLLAIAAAARDRVRVEEIGWTNERRAMRLYLVSAPENIARLDAIRADLARLADPRGLAAADREALIARTPAVVWINESVHGNEAPGFETAMQTLYHLAASEEAATLNALRNVVVVLNPSTNPDGHERFTVWYNSIYVGAPEPFAMEHNEPWSVQGRFNRFRFDMNRDVMTTTQREAQALVRSMLRWPPMVAIDQHGQTTNYFFPPTAAPMNENLRAGGSFQRWMEIYGRANAAAFDRYGWMYYSRDVFDFYGPFYWDSWPSLIGAIGMTYETDCGGWKGVLWRREDGSLCSFRDGIAKHFVSAVATIEATGARRAERVRDWYAFREAAVAEGRSGRMRRVVFLPGRDPVRAAELAATLLRSGIEVRRAGEAFASARAHSYATDAVGPRRFESGSYVVDLAQPLGRAARAVLEPVAALDTAFARTQIEKQLRNARRGGNVAREDYEFYDVTAWSLPVTFGVEAFWTEDAAPVSGPLLTLPAEPVVAAADGVAGGATIAAPPPAHLVRRSPPATLPVSVPAGVVGARPARSAYVFTAERNSASRLAYQLLADGHRVGAAAQPVDAGGRRWPRGTYVVRTARNDTSLHARIERLAREAGVEVTGVNTAFTEAGGQHGIGGEAVQDLRLPVIAVVGDEGISQTGYGAVWWTLEQRYGVRFTPVSTRWLTSGDLAQFNVIIMPSASPGALNRILGREGADRIRTWVQGGGTLVTMGGASAWAARENVNLTSARVVGADARPDTGAAAGAGRPTGDTTTAAARRRERTTERGAAPTDDLLAATSPTASNASPAPLPGTHFDVVLDRTHWLTHGYDEPRTTVMLEGSTFLRLSREVANVGVFPSTGRLHRAGFVWPDNTERLLRGTAFLIAEPVGGGHVVVFANEPLFRGWWRALDRLVLNAIVLGPAF